MLYPLSPDNAAPVLALFPADVHLAVAAALAGVTPAEVYADDPLYPRAATVILPSRRVYLAGSPESVAFATAFGALLRQRYLPLAAGAGPIACVITYFPASWSESLPAILGDVSGARFEREYYRIPLRALFPTPPIPHDVTLRRIDEALLADTTLANHASLVGAIVLAGPSLPGFLAHRFGYCLQRGRDLAAWCLSEYNTGGRCELSVETLPAFRHRSFALILGLAALRHAQSSGMTAVGWHCWQTDVAAIGLAQRLGFQRIQHYPVWYCRFGEPANAWRVYLPSQR